MGAAQYTEATAWFKQQKNHVTVFQGFIFKILIKKSFYWILKITFAAGLFFRLHCHLKSSFFDDIMAGMNKLLKEAQKMQQKMASVQEDLGREILDVTYGGGAVAIKINGHGIIQSVAIDPEFLKEGADVVNAGLLEALQEAQAKVNALSSDRMNAASGGLMGNLGSGFPGLF